MAGFCNRVPGLWTPKFVECEANLPKVSRHYSGYSRFLEDRRQRQGSMTTAARAPTLIGKLGNCAIADYARSCTILKTSGRRMRERR
jgi:hypothetical protein